MKNVVLFVFNGDPTCFIHVLLNGMDMREKDMHGRIIIEGAATGLLPSLANSANPLHKLWEKAKSSGIIDGVCKACAHKMGTADEAITQGLALLDDMSGHPSMSRYIDAGYEVVSF
jgi:hypothetical protein